MKELKGRVLYIHRCVFDDGAGIRTAVYLKGCPLRCPWCHNPESQNPNREIMFFREKCLRCVECSKACPEKKAPDFFGKGCSLCGKCAKVCPNGAVEIAGYEQTAEEVMRIVELDKNHYEHTGGGITVTGGEPLYQADFCAEIFKLCRKCGINTCVETSGAGNVESIKKLLPLTDTWLFDIKGDEDIYIRHIGIDFKKIYKNLRFLCENGADIILRCPIIPMFNDSEEFMGFLRSLRKSLDSFGTIKDIELLPFHRLGIDKYAAINKATAMKDTLPLNAERLEYLNGLLSL